VTTRTAARLDEAMKLRGYDQSRLARELDVSQGTISKIILGKTANSRLMPRIATLLGVSLAWLLNMSDDRLDGVRAANDDDDDTVEVTSLDVGYGLGATYIEEHSLEVEKVKFSRRWLRQYTDSDPELLFVATGIGDSMWPTIHDTDGVIVDRGETRVKMRDKLWAVTSGEIGMIKRLRPKPDGTMEIHSDNPQVSMDVATDGDLHIVGRVVAIVRKV
jgi:phage repressor protein C with HTH and peptisase S24 domain